MDMDRLAHRGEMPAVLDLARATLHPAQLSAVLLVTLLTPEALAAYHHEPTNQLAYLDRLDQDCHYLREHLEAVQQTIYALYRALDMDVPGYDTQKEPPHAC